MPTIVADPRLLAFSMVELVLHVCVGLLSFELPLKWKQGEEGKLSHAEGKGTTLYLDTGSAGSVHPVPKLVLSVFLQSCRTCPKKSLQLIQPTLVQLQTMRLSIGAESAGTYPLSSIGCFFFFKINCHKENGLAILRTEKTNKLGNVRLKKV